MKIHSPVLINYAAEIARAFDGRLELTNSYWPIRPGDIVKVTDFVNPADSFWIWVTKCEGNGLFVGRVGNYLFWEKPYNFGTLIRFGVENVCDARAGSIAELLSLNLVDKDCAQ